MVRPSKSFLYDRLESELKTLRGKVGIDAASADFKNRRMFKTDYYFGIDLDLSALGKGILKYNDERAVGIHADITNLRLMPTGCADAVVSTNTIYSIPADLQAKALGELCRITSPGGRLIIETSLDSNFPELLGVIKKYFLNVRVKYYRNPISRFYEWLFEKHGYLGNHPIAGRRPFRLFAWLVSRLEYLTFGVKAGNRHAFITAHSKIDNEKNALDFSVLPRSNHRIIDLTNSNAS
ncbi:MAG: hypothetical protein UY65_C0001G0023 [Parcubacteria group bacterium GW2011_GWA2_51_12]|nr:MAG: hypothetical protein UY65_C0001G0023 [Parcubacteria group bacterium GW2011_GWA2_51_12]